MVVTQASFQPPSLPEEGSQAIPLQPHMPVQQDGQGLDEHTERSQLPISSWEERGAGISLLSLLIKEQVSSACLHTVV